MKTISLILDRPVIERILDHIGDGPDRRLGRRYLGLSHRPWKQERATAADAQHIGRGMRVFAIEWKWAVGEEMTGG